jgi:putative peptide zinc metalloprotease protein
MKSDMFITDSDALMSLTVLSSHPIFSAFSTNSLMELISDCTVNSYRAEEVVVKEGDLVDAVFFILQGQCEVRKHTISASNEPIEEPIATLREEESIGLSEFGLFSSTGSRTASVVALTDTKVLCLNVRGFRLFLKNHPNAGDTFTQQLDMLMRMHFIKSVAPFASISNQHIRQIAEQIEEKLVDTGTTIFEQGESGDACYIITAGNAEIMKRVSDGSTKIIAQLGENAIFGESALLMDAPRNATVRVTEPTTILKIDKSLFNGITHQHVDAQEASMRLQLNRCRPIKVDNIDAYMHKNSDGEEITILRNTALGHYIQLSEQGLFLWNLLDGELSINEVALHYFRQFNVFHVEDIANQIMNLHNAGFIQLHRNEKINSSDQKVSVLTKLSKALEYKVLFGNADEMVGRSFNRVRWMFYSKPAMQIWMLLVMLGFISFLLHFERTIDLLAATSHPWILFLLSLFLVSLTIPLHEMAHAFTSKFYGLKVHSFALGWHWFAPFSFCDTSEVWLSPSRQRVMVDLAGVYLNAMLAGLACVCVYFLYPYYPKLTIILELFALNSYLYILAKLNTALECDGYYALRDGLDKPDLRVSSLKWLISVFSSESSIKTQYKEVVYWLITFLILFLIGCVSYVVLSSLLFALFGVNYPIFTVIVTVVVIITSLLNIYREFLLRISSRLIP